MEGCSCAGGRPRHKTPPNSGLHHHGVPRFMCKPIMSSSHATSHCLRRESHAQSGFLQCVFAGRTKRELSMQPGWYPPCRPSGLGASCTPEIVFASRQAVGAPVKALRLSGGFQQCWRHAPKDLLKQQAAYGGRQGRGTHIVLKVDGVIQGAKALHRAPVAVHQELDVVPLQSLQKLWCQVDSPARCVRVIGSMSRAGSGLPHPTSMSPVFVCCFRNVYSGCASLPFT